MFVHIYIVHTAITRQSTSIIVKDKNEMKWEKRGEDEMALVHEVQTRSDGNRGVSNKLWLIRSQEMYGIIN